MISDNNDPIVIVAGSGLLPVLIAQRLKLTGHSYRILALRGFADAETTRAADRTLDFLDVRGILECLKSWGAASVVLAGSVRRPKPTVLLGSYSLFKNMAELKELVARGDDQLLRGAVSILEDHGFKVIGAHEIVPEITCDQGVHSKRHPSTLEYEAIACGAELLKVVSPFDIGQGVVVSGRQILAVEGPEGTDKMLRRVATLQKKSFLFRSPSPFANSVFVKTAKLQQDLRVDMPAVGPQTIREIARAGIGGIALETKKTLILDREETIREANRCNVFVVGISSE